MKAYGALGLGFGIEHHALNAPWLSTIEKNTG